MSPKVLLLLHLSKRVWARAVSLCLSLKSNTGWFKWFHFQRDTFKKPHFKQANLLRRYNFNQRWAAAYGRKIGGYVAATVCKLCGLILARLHTGHIPALSCLQPVHTHRCSVSLTTTGATALLIQNIQHSFHSPLVASWLLFTPIIVLLCFTLHSISRFSFSRTEVYFAGSLFGW